MVRRMCNVARISCLVLLATLGLSRQVNAWDQIDPELLSLAAPRLDPEADAEALLWEIWIEDRVGNNRLELVKRQFVRLKIFNQRGVEKYSTLDLVSGTDSRISDVKGRTIKPDGTIVELEKASVFERTVVKGGGVKVRAKSFSMPNVEPGDIIEYGWKEVEHDEVANYLRLYTQRSVPTWKVVYHVKPLRDVPDGYTMRAYGFNCNPPLFKRESDGFVMTTLEDVLAFKEEPRMPPADHIRGWILLHYANTPDNDIDAFWKGYSASSYKLFKKDLKIDKPIKDAAARITDSAATEEEKVSRIRSYCLKEIQNGYHDRAGLSFEERAALPENKRPSQTLARRQGSGFDINMLFVALSRAAGLEASPVRLSGRDDRFFEPQLPTPYLLNRVRAGVKLGDGWQFHDLSAPYIPEGMLRWAEQDVPGLIPDPKDLRWIRTPTSAPERSLVRRSAEFVLSKAGSIAGTVRVELSGHPANARKNWADSLADDELAKFLEEAVRDRLSAAMVSQVKYTGVTRRGDSLSYEYQVTVPDYAQVTGKRMFLQPNYFAMNADPEFQTSERDHDIYFRYPWSEEVRISYEIPEGFSFGDLDTPDNPDLIETVEYEADLMSAEDKRLDYRRKLTVGANGKLVLPAKSYPAIKAAFDLVQQQDNHVVSLLARRPLGGTIP